MTQRFEAVFHEGEFGERLPEWCVVEWTNVNAETGAKFGRNVWKSYDMMTGEDQAKEMAYVLQQEYNLEFAENFA